MTLLVNHVVDVAVGGAVQERHYLVTPAYECAVCQGIKKLAAKLG
jgi:hypothetical protein